MKKLILIIPLLFFTFIFTETVKSQNVDYAQPAWYVSIGGTFDIHLFESTLGDISEGDVDLSDTWGIDVKVGKRIKKWFSIEAEYEYIQGFDFKILM